MRIAVNTDTLDRHTENENLAWALVTIVDLEAGVVDIDAVLPDGVNDEIRAALEGDSNDGEHDALVSVAGSLGIDYSDPYEDEQ